MEEKTKKIDDATLLGSEKLSEEDMDNVAGGTYKETEELQYALKIASDAWLKIGLWGRLKAGFGVDGPVDILSDLGIEADTSVGFFGAGSVNNTYRDKETGQFLLHKEVIEFLKTGKKSWRK